MANAFSGFAAQQCMGRAMASRLALGGGNDPLGWLNASLCVAQTFTTYGLLDDCHMIAHELGRMAWKIAKRRFIFNDFTGLLEATVALMDRCTLDCVEGCVHAVLIEFVAAALPMHQPTLQEVCRTAQITSDLRFEYACWHGLGHGLGSAAASGLISLAIATELCRSMATTSSVDSRSSVKKLSEYCMLGLGMQIIDTRVASLAALGLWEVKVESVCTGRSAAGKPLDAAALPAAAIPAATLPAAAVPVHNASYSDGVCVLPNRYAAMGNVGEALMFASRHDASLSSALCATVTVDELKEACQAGVGEEAWVVEHYKRRAHVCPAATGSFVHVSSPLVAVNRIATADVCGDGRCIWPETALNCAADCKSLQAPTSLPPAPPFWKVKQFAAIPSSHM
eukprot:CAMPEP_0119327932 /NCGR_PEP_ID=MMETSP1333-20130426/71995_1 /TAXON_ID=418940 /ORGANISM="Scyphosphaera apsteinii, Strain RCC1455" /LENGTH=395 /DNA_ID=CAMNT_0007336657 /DNA_START=39 /DNA_END=1226 /DNA_ORIENTATION=+